jgi:hypothetical protein
MCTVPTARSVPVIVDAFGVVRNRANKMDSTPAIVPSDWSQKSYR